MILHAPGYIKPIAIFIFSIAIANPCIAKGPAVEIVDPWGMHLQTHPKLAKALGLGSTIPPSFLKALDATLLKPEHIDGLPETIEGSEISEIPKTTQEQMILTAIESYGSYETRYTRAVIKATTREEPSSELAIQLEMQKEILETFMHAMSEVPTIAQNSKLPSERIHQTLAELLSMIDTYAVGEDTLAHDPAEAARVHQQLNAAFHPLVADLYDHVRQTPRLTLQKRLRNLEQTSPIQKAFYDGQIARIDHSIMGKDNIENQLEYSLKFLEAKQQQFYLTLNLNIGRKKFDLDSLDGSSPELLWVAPNGQNTLNHTSLMNMFELTMTPLSYYGEDFSKQLLRTTQIMINIALEHLTYLSNHTYVNHTAVIEKHTANARNARAEGTPQGLAPLTTTVEGILTFHQFVAAMLADPVPGTRTGKRALRELIRSGANPLGLTTEFTRRIPFGLMGPMNLSGKYFRNPLVRNTKGRLEFSAKVKNKLKEFIKDSSQDPSGADICRIVCPVASALIKLGLANRSGIRQHGEITGLQLVAETYLQIFNAVYAYETSRLYRLAIDGVLFFNHIRSYSPIRNARQLFSRVQYYLRKLLF